MTTTEMQCFTEPPTDNVDVLGYGVRRRENKSEAQERQAGRERGNAGEYKINWL